MTRQKPPKPTALKPGGPDKRAEAMGLLADGHQLSSVARALGLPRTTVKDWRDGPEGQRLLDAARAERAAALDGARDGALRILREAAPLAAQRLVDALAAPSSASVGAAEAILARVGLPRSTKVEATVDPGLDLAALTDDEFAALEALYAKARR
jgi:hypothetical protein